MCKKLFRKLDCETFNYRRSPISGCKIIYGTVESSEIFAVPNEGWDYYAPQKKRELPCKLLNDGKNADTYSKALYGKVLTTAIGVGSFCDFDTDGGGWTRISHLDYWYVVSNNGYKLINDITRMAESEFGNFILGQVGFVQLYSMFNFRQVRFRCSRRRDGVVLDVATAENEVGDWVLAHLLGLMPNNR